jgi:hypothetical protein
MEVKYIETEKEEKFSAEPGGLFGWMSHFDTTLANLLWPTN